MNARILHLHVDRIVVEGLPEAAQHRFTQALKSGLNRIAEEGLPAGMSTSRRRISSVNAGPVPPGCSAERAAGQVVRAIRQSISSTSSVHVEAKHHG